ncbi:hypothetical protein [Ruficoccus sp. ZRK36]|uniref:hypothetical protein n=1 Tax=Ruficoccus sp. ZRK36 TaxID=2866311 RepID=UPI001C72F7A2|nr:hypothetical protein [Ruficoccus sp. ZRK36]QYY35292.1 hypothetical protein K0V07_13445 [Ruficoccus sp. ZRK36]
MSTERILTVQTVHTRVRTLPVPVAQRIETTKTRREEASPYERRVHPQPLLDGAQAARLGLPRAANPYVLPLQRRDWFTGFDHTRREMARA